MGNTGREGPVPRATSGGGGAGLRPAGADAGRGREETFGPYGGRYVPETLIPALDGLGRGMGGSQARVRGVREGELRRARAHLRRAPLPHSRSASRFAPTKRIYIKREDLNHTGAHKFNNVLGQALLAKRLGKKRLIAETGAGQHGMATATIAAKFGFECVIYMGRGGRPEAATQRLLDGEAGRRWSP